MNRESLTISGIAVNTDNHAELPTGKFLTTITGGDDFLDVIEELTPIKSKWRSIGAGLRLKPGKLDEIEAKRHGAPTECLLDVVSSWLNKEYNWQRFGEPTWRRIVEVVEHSAAGGSPETALSIAKRHQGMERSV